MKNFYLKLASFLFLVFALFSQFQSLSASSNDLIDQEIADLNLKIQLQKQQIDKIRSQQLEYEEQIIAKKNEQVTLNKQLEILDVKLGKTELEIEETALSLDKLALEIKKTEIDIENTENKIDDHKDKIANLIKLIHQQEQVSTLEVLLLNNSLSEFLSQIKYLESTNDKISDSVKDLKKQKDLLEKDKNSLEEKNKEVSELKHKLEDYKESLDYEQDQKVNILEQTKMSEKAFQDLLLRARAEQNAAQADIAKSEALIRQKLSEKDKQKLDSGDSTMSWPVSKNVITASFRDASYPYSKIIGEHSGIDIRAAHGSPIYAAADGYVAQAKFNGTKDYAYIMIIHASNLATVYGHISAVNVSVDDYVVRGQVIGRTGGTPGSIGAGSFTTGPHLHFEVRKAGLPVNPVNYLP